MFEIYNLVNLEISSHYETITIICAINIHHVQKFLSALFIMLIVVVIL